MSRRTRTIPIAACGLVVAAALPAAQPEVPGDPVASYLERLELDEALARHLRDQLESAAGDEKRELAQQLGAIYVRWLTNAVSPEERREVEELARSLLVEVPDAQTHELRLSLEKVRYLEAERIAERHRLRMTQPGELEEANRILSSTRDSFQAIGTDLHRRVERLRELERRGRESDDAVIEEQLAEALRQRSIAMYYAGWSNYYLALINDVSAPALEAVRDFGWLLNASGEKVPTVEGMPPSYYRFDHVSRAAVGVALCFGLRGEDESALRWMEAVRSAPEASPEIKESLFARRMVVYAGARRWADIEWMLRERERRTGDASLDPLEARLLAVLTLEAASEGPRREDRLELIEALAQTALGELVRQGEISHVLDLMDRYGATPIGQDGFIVRYARGLKELDDARRAHRESGRDADEPTDDPSLREAYASAAEVLAEAIGSEDAGRFPGELARAGVQHGLALYYGGRLAEAAAEFERAASLDASPEIAREAIWFAIVALERAKERGTLEDSDRLTELSARFLERFPADDRSASLLMRRAGADLMPPADAANVLLGVDPQSPLYDAARRRAADLLYRAYREAPEKDRSFAAERFVAVAAEVVRSDARQAIESNELAERAAETVVRHRQLLDAILSSETPDLSLARRVLDELKRLAEIADLDLTPVAGELAFRRLQIALVANDAGETDSALAELDGLGGRYADAARTLLYRRAASAWLDDPEDLEACRELLRHGSRLTADRIDDEEGIADPELRTVAQRVARAGDELWRREGDELGRELAIRHDEAIIRSGLLAEESLLRHARLAEGSGNAAGALESWRLLLAASQSGSDAWYRARYESLRLLASSDRERAVDAMRQFMVLHPSFGPEPWSRNLRELAGSLGLLSPGGGG
ncbi:MAG: hypothetical protein ACF8SC_13415 [Phycisphaerales bacterium JB037]